MFNIIYPVRCQRLGKVSWQLKRVNCREIATGQKVSGVRHDLRQTVKRENACVPVLPRRVSQDTGEQAKREDPVAAVVRQKPKGVNANEHGPLIHLTPKDPKQG